MFIYFGMFFQVINNSLSSVVPMIFCGSGNLKFMFPQLSFQILKIIAYPFIFPI